MTKLSKVFFEVHKGLPRQGPGNRASTLRALAAVPRLPEYAEVLDIGCGPGMQTKHLAAQLPNARITAVDLYPEFVKQAQANLEPFGDRVSVQVGDMADLPFPNDAFDLLWCEGAAYIVGIENGLTLWRPLLRQGGHVAFTECVWLKPDVPDELRNWWQAAYPQMGDVACTRGRVKAAGYELVNDFVLPEVAWWEDYYLPMQERIRDLRQAYEDNDEVLQELDGEALEISYYERYPDCYSYAFFVARKTGG